MDAVDTKSKNTKEMNIDPEIFAVWKKHMKRGDIKEIAEALNYSEPVIGWALKYGYVNKTELLSAINNFYIARIDAAKAQATELISKSKESEA